VQKFSSVKESMTVSHTPYVTNQVPEGSYSSGFANALCNLKAQYKAYWFSAH